MANEKNLKPLNSIDKEQAKKIRQKGQAAQKAKQRQAKTYREIAQAILPSKVKDTEIIDVLRSYGVTDEIDLKTLTFFGMIKAAANGSPQAFQELLKVIGELDDSDKQENSINIIIGKRDVDIGD